MKQLWTVAAFEFSTFAKNKAFVAITILLMVIALIAPAVPVIIPMVGNITGERTIAVVDHTGGAFDPSLVAENIGPAATFFPNAQAAIQAVEDGYHNYVLELYSDRFTLHVTAMGIGVTNLQHQAAALVRNHHRVTTFATFGVGEDQVRDVLAFDPPMEVLTLADADADADTFFENFIYAYAMVFVLYFALLAGGSHLLTTVVREKSTKTMELLVTSCPPSKMLNGKVLGVCAAILTQVILMVTATLVSMAVTPRLTGDEAIFTVAINPLMLLYLVVFFLLGFLMYAYIYAALASTASRQEDATSLGQVPQLLIVAGFFGAMLGMQSPGAGWLTIGSHIPLTAPFLMFVRVAMGTAQNWEIAVSLIAQVVTIGIISWVGVKIYRMGTLMYGTKLTLKGVLEALK